jgi:DNA-directed RNA polymerase specialized sigma24 family protein
MAIEGLTPELVQRALSGDISAQTRLVAALTPEIQWSVGKMLRRWRTGTAAARDLRQEVEDMVQEVFLEIFEDDGKVLRRWDPQRLPLEAYIGYIARIRTAEVLRSRRSPWREDPNPAEDLDRDSPRKNPEEKATLRDEMQKIYLCVVAGFQAMEYHLFDLLFIRQLAPKAAVAETGKSLDAIYKWRSRLYEKARKCRDLVSRVQP